MRSQPLWHEAPTWARSRVSALAGLAVALVATNVASAQQPTNAFASGTGPSPGQVTLMEQFRYTRMTLRDGTPAQRGRIREFSLENMVHVGLLPELTLAAVTPLSYRDRRFERGPREEDAGVGDATIFASYRFLRHDFSPLNTLRVSALAGGQVRTGDGPFTGDSYNPLIGLAFTAIVDRHGFNGDCVWTFTTDGLAQPLRAGESTADALRYDLAYLYRLYPVEYAADTPGALYAVCELNGVYETNGDNELLIAPGIMWEAATWALEVSAQAPIWRGISNRAETDYSIVIGLRLTF
ncbi:MAG: hypothetical protein HRU75_07830 [Planctomycetia bacterium]|nr:MAG: hypothetical protein HRU75_07830 [Planctomycetia bacterium]